MDGPKPSAKTLAAQGMGWVDPATKAIIPPIHAATTFIRDPDNQYRAGHAYARDDNPTFEHAESLLAALEGGAGCLTFASGMAAATTVFQVLEPGDHVVAPQVMYWALRNWLTTFGRQRGLQVDLVDATDLGAIATALRPGVTKLVWIETPANPTWAITDIAAAAELAHGAGARLAVDSTVATPVLTRPLDDGADLVMHSATKYLNGHSDVIAGALVTARADEFWQQLGAFRRSGGAVPGAFESWLLLRGMRTLYLRVERACRTAAWLASQLSEHPEIAQVLYPGLPSHPGHSIAARQMEGGFGGMLSIRVRGGEEASIASASKVRIWKRATSLGGVESLIEHRASIEGAGTPAPSDLLRLSVGIEAQEDLLADLDQALHT
ncbi:MAG: PLP-dependent aspartate aminotransferase family protein [Pseudomonadota bacterium]